MRKRFEQQLSLGILPISEVSFDTRSRHQSMPFLRALQYVFVTPELNDKVFELLEEKILKGKKKTGRLGLTLWEILVLSLTRLNLKLDYDFLLNLANHHEQLRGIMGVRMSDYTSGRTYKYQTIVDNVSLLDEETLRQINVLIVESSHGLIKKKEEVEDLDLSIKVDSYVIERTIHFPTDLNLLWDSGRKCYDVIEALKEECTLRGWGKLNYNKKQFRNAYRNTSEIHRKKGGNYKEKLAASTKIYLGKSRTLSEQVSASFKQGALSIANGDLSSTLKVAMLLKSLAYYHQMLDKHIDLVERRILQGEKIPHSEKVFSIFEEEVEWLSKGKLHKKVELGNALSIATDQYHFIVDYEIMIGMSDEKAGQVLGRRIAVQYGTEHTLSSISFDRGYYSSLVKEALSKDFKTVVMPKRGKKSLRQEEEESTDVFQQKRRAHSAVESNINQLEHNGLDRCPDKGVHGFKRYVALGILSYNLHRMGKILIALDKKKMEQANTQRKAA